MKPKWNWQNEWQSMLPESLNKPEFTAAYFEWGEHRQEIGKRLTPTTVKKQLKMLEGIGIRRAIAAIEFSIGCSYMGIFEQKTGREQGPQKPVPTVAEVIEDQQRQEEKYRIWREQGMQ